MEDKKLLLLRQIKNKSKYNGDSRNKQKSFDIKPSYKSFENEINKNNNKKMNMKKKSFQTIKDYINYQKQYNMLKTGEFFYKKKKIY